MEQKIELEKLALKPIQKRRVDNNTYNNRANKQAKQKKHFKSKQLVETLKCECGNTIKMFKKHDEVKCFKCNHKHRKENGEWVMDTFKADVLTFSDLVKRIKGNKIVFSL
jgi:hypothetical protein